MQPPASSSRQGSVDVPEVATPPRLRSVWRPLSHWHGAARPLRGLLEHRRAQSQIKSRAWSSSSTFVALPTSARRLVPALASARPGPVGQLTQPLPSPSLGAGARCASVLGGPSPTSPSKAPDTPLPASQSPQLFGYKAKALFASKAALAIA